MLVLVNSIILIGAVAIALGSVFWKHLARRPNESVRAVIATIIGTVGIIMFLLQVSIMTIQQGENLITFIIMWLNS